MEAVARSAACFNGSSTIATKRPMLSPPLPLVKCMRLRSNLAITAKTESRITPTFAVSEAHEIATSASSVNDSTFHKLVLESEIPVLVEFWAPWCGPCRMIAPLIDELARQYAGKVRCLKLNTDECPSLATEYGIRSIPTVMVFVKGVMKDTVVGAVPKSSLTSMVDKHLEWR